MIAYVHRGAEHKGAAGETLIQAALADYMGAEWENWLKEAAGRKGASGRVPDGLIRRTPHGKPYIEDFPLYFSISHSGELWVCLVAEVEVGVDIQVPKPLPYEKLAKRFFTETEAAYIRQGGLEAFFQVWTRKEAYVKYTGLGFSGMGFSSFSVVEARKRSFLDGAEAGGTGTGEDQLELVLASQVAGILMQPLVLELGQELEAVGPGLGPGLLPGEQVFGAVCGKQKQTVVVRWL
ncbi:4'-phosphopantetheinyl transferase superfamily protein [Aminipila butyrica]|uniref:4'-phosphopantetheinyl transferase superfamily protein n=1 Tax=Aminipila butyrica TaxID=433296 RepID=A0A858BUC5_9FIRM|nr:4'-phosphopantetheinyl transferase superfamily protein [Aminipila butyrica]QIB69177.1 4'-phosphopantetheinyl transferase superfamily protein [Aminipila butyrica]